MTNEEKLIAIDGLISRYEEIAEDYKNNLVDKSNDFGNFCINAECWSQTCIIIDALKNYRTLINSIVQCSRKDDKENG